MVTTPPLPVVGPAVCGLGPGLRLVGSAPAVGLRCVWVSPRSQHSGAPSDSVFPVAALVPGRTSVGVAIGLSVRGSCERFRHLKVA